MSAKAVLTVRELTTRIAVASRTFPVVNGISFDLYRGKTLALVGESGCGKSMTALSIMRILPHPPALPPEGEVLYGEENLLALSEKKMRQYRGAKLAMIFQDPMGALNPVYTVGWQLMEVASLHLGLYGDEARKLAVKSLRDVGIPDPESRMHDYPHQLSGGMQQRVMIGMALMCEPDILIADEPTTALDVTIQAQILDLMRELQQRKGMAILLITHDMGVVAEMADEVIVMYATQAVEQGQVGTIFENMAHPYTEGLFASLPGRHAHAHDGPLHTIQGSVPSISNLPEGCPFHPRCPYAFESCRKGDVPSFTMKRGHIVNCWRYVNK